MRKIVVAIINKNLARMGDSVEAGGYKMTAILKMLLFAQKKVTVLKSVVHD